MLSWLSWCQKEVMHHVYKIHQFGIVCKVYENKKILKLSTQKLLKGYAKFTRCTTKPRRQHQVGLHYTKEKKKPSGKTEQWRNLTYLYLGQVQLNALERILLKVKGEGRMGNQEGGGCLSLRNNNLGKCWSKHSKYLKKYRSSILVPSIVTK